MQVSSQRWDVNAPPPLGGGWEGVGLGSSSVTTDANGAPTASALYKAFGETRYTLGNLNTDYKFTGQRDEPSLGIYFFQSRWYDGSLGRFTQPDSIVPTGTQGTQAWDRYAFVNNNPVRYNDPTGHDAVPWNTFFISFIPINFSGLLGWQAGVGLAVDLRPLNTFLENTIKDGALDANKLPEELARLVNDASARWYTTSSLTFGIEGGAQINATAGVSTTTMDEWEGTTTFAQQPTFSGEVCDGLCLGAVAGDNLATDNPVDTIGISIGGGFEEGLSMNLATTTHWLGDPILITAQ